MLSKALKSRIFHVLVFRFSCVGVCTSVLELVVLLCTLFMVACMCRQESVHIELFVAGLAPWEPILHLSIPHSGAQWSPNFTLNLPAADPFSQWHHRPHYFQASLSNTCSHTNWLCLSLFLCLFRSDIHTQKDLSLLSVSSFTHSGTVTVTPTHSSVMSLE